MSEKSRWKAKELVTIFLNTWFRQQPCPPQKVSNVWSRRVSCASHAKLHVHFLPSLFMGIEGNIVYVLQIFPRKKGTYFVLGTKVHLVYFMQFGMDIFFFLSLAGKGWLMLSFPTVWTYKTNVYHCFTGEGCYNRWYNLINCPLLLSHTCLLFI